MRARGAAARGRGGARGRRRRRRGLRVRGRRARGARPRRRGREPHRGDPARDRRPRLDRRPGRLRLRHRPLGERGSRELAARAAEAARVADEDEFAGPPAADGGEPRADRRALSDPVAGRVADRPRWPSWRSRSSARRSTPTPRIAGVEQAVYADSAERVAIASSTGDRRASIEASSCYAYLQALAEGDGGPRDRARLRPRAAARRRSTRPRSAARAPSARAAMIGAGKPASRSLPGRPRPDRRRQLRRPDRRRPRRRRRAARPLAVRRAARRGGRQPRPSSSHDDGLDPAGLGLLAVRRRGRAAPAHRADRGRARCAPSSTTPTRPAAAAPPRPATPAAPATARSPRSRPRTWSSRRARSASRSCSREAGEGVYVTDVAGLHSGVNPVSGVFSVGASGRAISGGELGRAGARVHDRQRPRLDAAGGARRPARRRAGCPSAARSALRRC